MVYGIKSAVGSHLKYVVKKSGIVGYGHIRFIIKYYCGISRDGRVFLRYRNKLPLGNAKQLHTLEELLGSCDVISLQVPDLPSTRNLMSAETYCTVKTRFYFDQCGTWYGSRY